MSKFGLLTGLIISAVLHAWLFRYGINPNQSTAPEQSVEKTPAVAAVDIVKLTEPDQPDPEMQTVKQSEPEPVAKPMKQKPPPSNADIPDLTESGKKTQASDRPSGDFAGQKDGIAEPVVRINWGRLDNAVSILKKSGMKLVIYESGGSLKKQVNIDGTEISIKPLSIDQTIRYSDSLRIVDNVPAFSMIRKSLKLSDNNHLAIIVPVEIERLIESAKISEISRRSLSLKDVKVLGGRFDLADGKVNFIIEKVLLRS